MNLSQCLFIPVFVIGLFSMALPLAAQDNERLPLRGINMAGAEFAGNKLPGKVNKDYVFPSKKFIDEYSEFGFELIRLPFKWERLQPELEGPLDNGYLNNIRKVVQEAAKRDVYVVLDVHNYGTYRGEKIGSEAVSQDAFNDLWAKLATDFKDDKNVIFGIMNEPNKHDAAEWFPIAQNALTSIREAGATQKVLVPSTLWSNAHRFLKKDGEYSNAELLKNIKDPQNNFVFEVHTYFDKDNTGTNKACAGEDVGVKRLRKITQWLKDNNFQAFLGEFGVSQDEQCLQALEKAIAYMDENSDAWYGWSYWGASPWFGDYMYNMTTDVDSYPQARIVKTYIDKSAE